MKNRLLPVLRGLLPGSPVSVQYIHKCVKERCTKFSCSERDVVGGSTVKPCNPGVQAAPPLPLKIPRNKNARDSAGNQILLKIEPSAGRQKF